jgi:branched-chain amino acid transport system substrate-binding protein
MKNSTKCQVILGLAVSFFLILGIGGAGLEAKEVVKIGMINPFTGPAAAIGLGMKNSMDLRIRQANRSNEFPEYDIEMVALDDASDPATGVSMAYKLGSDPKVIAASAHYNSPVSLATCHVFHKFGLLNIASASVHPDIIKGNNYKEIVRIVADVTTETALGGKLLVSQLGYKNWCVVHDTTAYGKTENEWFTKDLKARGGRILSVDAVTVGTKDFRPILTKIKELKPDGIYGGFVVQEASLLKIQMNELGMNDILFYAGSGSDSYTFNDITGASGEGTVIIGKSFISDDSQFAIAYRAEKFSSPYENGGPFAYDATGIILMALKKVGPNRKAIVDYVNDPGFSYNGVTGLIILKDRQTTTGGLVVKVSQDGKWVNWDQSQYFSGKKRLPGLHRK